MIAVTGSTGELGGRVARRLAKLGVAQRLIVRDPARAPQLAGAEIVQASSYSDAVAMGRALSGVETLFMVSAHDRFGVVHHALLRKETPPFYDRLQQQVTAVDAAAAVGVKHIIYLSVTNAFADATFILAHDHYRTEEYIRSIGVPFTFIRMSLYIDHIPMFVSDDGVIRAPAGEGRGNWVTRDDLADVIVAVLTGSGHEGQSYNVTGPEAINMREVAERMSAATGRKISYQMQTPHEARSTRSTSGMDKFDAERREATGGTGLDEWEVEMFVTHFMQIAAGELSTVSDTVPRLTGHQAQSLAEYLKTHPESYQHLLTV